MYAIIDDGGMQYKVSEGETIQVGLREQEAGASIEFDRVLLVSGDKGATVGTPVVEGAKVVAEVVAPEVKGPKILIQHFQKREEYRRRVGHRQRYTSVKIKQIVAPGQSA